METIAARYDEEARDAGVYIVTSCGRLPSDLGALLLQRTFNGKLAYVENFMSVQNSVSIMGEVTQSVRQRLDLCMCCYSLPLCPSPDPDIPYCSLQHWDVGIFAA